MVDVAKAPPAAPLAPESAEVRAADEASFDLSGLLFEGMDFRYLAPDAAPAAALCARMRSECATLKTCAEKKSLPSEELLKGLGSDITALMRELPASADHAVRDGLAKMGAELDKALKAYGKLTGKLGYTRGDLEEILQLDGPRNAKDVWHTKTLLALNSSAKEVTKALPTALKAVESVEGKKYPLLTANE